MAGEVIRPARATDAPEIARLICRSKAEAMPWLAVPHTPAEDEAWVAGVLLPEHEVSVAVREDDGALIGVMALRPGWVDQLYVSTAAQGSGVGSVLLRRAQDASAEPLQLWTFQRNARARAFYERRGFVEVRATDGDNEEREPDVLYRWTPSVA